MDNDISRCERYPTSRYARVEVGPLGEQPIPVVVRTGSDSFLILPGFFTDHEAEYPIVGVVVVQPQCLLHPIHYLAEHFISIFYDM